MRYLELYRMIKTAAPQQGVPLPKTKNRLTQWWQAKKQDLTNAADQLGQQAVVSAADTAGKAANQITNDVKAAIQASERPAVQGQAQITGLLRAGKAKQKQLKHNMIKAYNSYFKTKK